eukprot:jgi/Botrbrau1/3201/Bobra.37_2s0031.1
MSSFGTCLVDNNQWGLQVCLLTWFRHTGCTVSILEVQHRLCFMYVDYTIFYVAYCNHIYVQWRAFGAP